MRTGGWRKSAPIIFSNTKAHWTSAFLWRVGGGGALQSCSIRVAGHGSLKCGSRLAVLRRNYSAVTNSLDSALLALARGSVRISAKNSSQATNTVNNGKKSTAILARRAIGSGSALSE